MQPIFRLLDTYKRGRFRVYALDSVALRGVFDWVSTFEAFWPAKLEALGAHLRGKANG